MGEFYRGILGRVCRYETYERQGNGWAYRTAAEPGETLSYGELHDVVSAAVEPDHLLVPTMLLGSDYSGSTLEIDNLRGFMAEHGGAAGVHEVSGGHGTRGAAIRIGDLTDAMVEALARLSDYPVWNDDTLSEVESELADEAWDSWAERDFARELEEEWIICFEQNPSRDWFETIRDRANVYWESDGPDMTIRLERVVVAVTLEDLLALPDWTFEDETLQSFLDAFRAGNLSAALGLHDTMVERGLIA